MIFCLKKQTLSLANIQNHVVIYEQHTMNENDEDYEQHTMNDEELVHYLISRLDKWVMEKPYFDKNNPIIISARHHSDHDHISISFSEILLTGEDDKSFGRSRYMDRKTKSLDEISTPKWLLLIYKQINRIDTYHFGDSGLLDANSFGVFHDDNRQEDLLKDLLGLLDEIDYFE